MSEYLDYAGLSRYHELIDNKKANNSEVVKTDETQLDADTIILGKEANSKKVKNSGKTITTTKVTSTSTDSTIPTSKAVWNAIADLDSDLNNTSPGASKTITSFSLTDGKVSVTFSDISITKSLISDFSHTHGNILNGGTLLTNDITIANGDKLVVTDSSDSNKIARTSVSFDGSTTTKALTQKGTFETFAKLDSPEFTGTPTAPTATAGTNTTQIATTEFVLTAVANGIAENDAMVYKTTIAGGSTGSYGALTPAANKGWTYKVSAAGKINGVAVDVGDMLICNTDDTVAATSSNYSTIVNNWGFIERNLDGAVTGPASSTNNHIAIFDGTTGKIIKDGTYIVEKSVPSDAVFTDTKVTSSTNHYTPTTSNGSDKTASATGASASYNLDVVTGLTINTDGKGHITGLSVNSGKTPAQPTIGNKALKVSSNTGTATQAITMNESSADRTIQIKGDGTWISGAVSGSSNAPVITLSHQNASTGSALTTSNGTAGTYTAGTEYTVLTGVTVSADSKGHITGVSTNRLKVKDTTYKFTIDETTLGDSGGTSLGQLTHITYGSGSTLDNTKLIDALFITE